MSDEPRHVDQHVTGQGNPVAARDQHIGTVVNHFAPSPGPPAGPVWQPPPRSLHFTGRVEDLEKITALLTRHHRVALIGPGGMGKTALAAEVLFQLAPAPGPQSRWPGGIYSHDYYRQGAHPSALAGLLGQAGIHDLRQVDLTGEVRRLFSQPGVLLYLEGCEKADDLTALLDLTGQSRVLLTTRDKQQRGDAHAYELHPLGTADAAQLLHYHARQTTLPAASGPPLPVRHEPGEGRGAGQPPSLLPRPMRHEWGEGWGEGSSQPGRPTSPQPSPPAAGGEGDGASGFSAPQWQSPGREHPAWVPWLKLAAALGGHPLALRLAGARMLDQQESPEEFAASQQVERFGDWAQRDQRKDNLHRLFAHSADAVAAKHPRALELWFALALHAHAPVPLTVLCACVGGEDGEVRQALAALVNLSLAERGEFPGEQIGHTEPAWQLTHALLGEWGREEWLPREPWATAETPGQGTRPTQCRPGALTGPGGETAQPRSGRGDRPSPPRGDAILRAGLEWWEQDLSRCFNASAVPGGPDRYQALQPHWDAVLRGSEQTHGADSRDLTVFLTNTANAHYCMGNYASAEALYRRALQIRKRVLGHGHPDTLASVTNLALLLDRKRDVKEAEQLYRWVLEVRARTLGREHPDTLDKVILLAMFLWANGDLAGAESLAEWAAHGFLSKFGPEHQLTKIAQNSLAGIRQQRAARKWWQWF